MLGPIVLPLQITLVAFAFIGAVALVWLRSRKKILILGFSLALMFVPSCTGMMWIVDQFRYGRFEYATFSEMPVDRHVELPPQSSNIVLYKNSVGHTARFRIETGTLMQWIRQMRELRPELNPMEAGQDQPEEVSEEVATGDNAPVVNDEIAVQTALLNRGFPEANWEYDPRMRSYSISINRQGGGYTVWHVPESGFAYVTGVYW